MNQGIIGRIIRFLNTTYEKPCGCVLQERQPRFPQNEPEAEVLEEERRLECKQEYTNATVYKYLKWARLRCVECGAVYEKTAPADTRTDYGEENPDAGRRLRTEHKPGARGGRWVTHDDPVVVSDE
jgi:hypothetical protein